MQPKFTCSTILEIFQGNCRETQLTHLDPDTCSQYHLSDGDSTSALSSALSGMLTLTLEALSNMESMRSPDPPEQLLSERKEKI